MDIGTDFDQSTAKYVIRARIDIDGVVDKPDVVGALFGQTEGLLGEDLDLRELQRTGRIGRIQIVVRSEGGNSRGEIVIPVSLDKTATAILAASIETVDRVGPCKAKVTLDKLEDIRGAKRRRVVSRAISILKGWEEDISPGSDEITQAVTKAKKRVVAKYGPDKLPVGPDFDEDEEMILVEGRADIINLMKNGVTNTVAVEGTHVPKSIADLTKRKNNTVIAFLDGDRGGDLILRELMQVARIDFIARAPEGKEVEDLTRREITKALQSKIPADQALALVQSKSSSDKKKRGRKPRTRERQPKRKEPSESRKPAKREKKPPEKPSVPKPYLEKIQELKESFKAALFNNKMEVIAECGVAELTKVLKEQDAVDAVVLDGVITQRLIDSVNGLDTRLLIAAAVADIDKPPLGLRIITFDEIE
ncbi:DNA primase [Candidatus Thorarchaeota archaeon]|nr:MAG: DNA primase [Candidatus Thorarchaeota archaeon]